MISNSVRVILIAFLVQICSAERISYHEPDPLAQRAFLDRSPLLNKCLYQYGDQCITYHPLSTNQTRAKQVCEQQERGILTPIESKQKYDYMTRLITRIFTHNYWIGNDTKIVDSKSSFSSFFGIGKKEQNCTYLNIRHGLLQDHGPCSLKFLYVCEITGRDKCKNLPMRIGGQTCFDFSTQTVATYSEAQAECKKKGGVVPNMQTREQLEEVRKGILEEKWWLDIPESKLFYYNDANKNATAVHNVWVGMDRSKTGIKTQWTNTDGTPMTYNDQWDKSEPNNHKNEEYCAMIKQNFKMNDVPCNQIYGYFCQTKSSAVWRPDGSHTLLPFQSSAQSKKPLVQIIYGVYDIDTADGSPLMQALKSFGAHTQPAMAHFPQQPIG